MQVNRKDKQFEPITITLETAKEVLELYAAISETTGAMVKKGLKENDISYSFDLDPSSLTHVQLYRALKPYIEQAKEAL